MLFDHFAKESAIFLFIAVNLATALEILGHLVGAFATRMHFPQVGMTVGH
jgi:hypothetical protein